jgi:arsenical pump membrane protein
VGDRVSATVWTWAVAGLATLGVIVGPWRLPAWIWAVAGAVVLVVARLIPLGDALGGVWRGADVYLFLIGMMLLAEIANQQGVFVWLAARAGRLARGSASRLFWLIYLVGTGVTIFLSNDATAVVLTPAVAAVVRAMRVERPLPYLYICAFVANAASFVLPISNPANLVIYGSRMPGLIEWVPRFALPSLLAIAATYAVLRITQRRELRQPLAIPDELPRLPAGGVTALLGIAATAIVLLVASGLRGPLGLPTCLAGVATALAVLIRTRSSPVPLLRGVSWGVLALVAGLFVLVAALERTGLVATLARGFGVLVHRTGSADVWAEGGLVAAACNLTNNLPAGLLMGSVLEAGHASHRVTAGVLVGIDLGPNFSITGSLATVLWLQALRREGHHVTGWAFLKLGLLVTIPALVLALACLALLGG